VNECVHVMISLYTTAFMKWSSSSIAYGLVTRNDLGPLRIGPTKVVAGLP